jgi:hypothetical protein
VDVSSDFCFTVAEGDLPQHNAAILSAAASMLPCLSSQLKIDCATDAFVDDRLCVDPCVYNQAGAGFEVVCLAVLVRGIEVVEQRRGGHLCRLVAGARCLCGRGRVDRHARVVDETHGCGRRRVAPSVVEVNVDDRRQERSRT